MKSKDNPREQTGISASSKQNLRRRAEEAARTPEDSETLSPERTRDVIHDLRVHQIELEMQNEELRRAQAELEAVRARYFDLYDLAPVGYVTVSEQGLILEANLTAATLLGVDRGALVKRRFSSFIVEAHTDIYYLYRKKLLDTGEPQACELRMAKKDGTAFWARMEATLVREPGGAPVCRMALSDISEHKRGEKALGESEEWHQTILQTAMDGFWLVDMEGRFLEVNDSYCRMSGYSRQELLSMRIPGLEARESESDTAAHMQKTMEQGHDRFESRHRRKNGSIVDVEVSVQYRPADGGRMAVFLRDITGRKRLEGTQKFLLQCGSPGSGKSFFEALAEYLSQSLGMEYVCIDRLDGDGLTAHTVAIYNNGAHEPNASYALKDTPCGDVVGKTICCFPRDASRLYPRDAALQDLKAESYVGTTLWSHDGKPIGLIAIIGQKPLVDPGLAEAVLKLVAVRAAGELERKKAEEDNLRLREKAELSSRLATVGEMAAGIAHEINNPLTGVVGFSELLLARDLPADVKEELKIVNDGSQRVKEIVRHMLTFARQTRPVKTRTDIHELIDNTLAIRSYVLRTANIEVVREYDPALPRITADPGQLQQVFLNIIVNAEHAMKKAHGRGTLAITTRRAGDRVRLSFRDDGPGMMDEVKGKMFNPFFTTKDPGEGTGLGLGLSRSIILEHGGTIEVESESGQGASFIIELPIGSPPGGADTPAGTPVSRAAARTAKILVVDDEPAIRAFVKAVLVRDGHTVEGTGKPEEVLHILGQGSYDMIIMDFRMPGMSGMELYARIAEKHPGLAGKVLFITGDTSDVSVRDFLGQHKLPHIAKPFDRETLVERVNEILAN